MFGLRRLWTTSFAHTSRRNGSLSTLLNEAAVSSSRMIGVPCCSFSNVATKPSGTNGGIGSLFRFLLPGLLPSTMPKKGLWEPFDMDANYSNISSPPVEAIQTSTLPNGLRVCSMDTLNPMTSLGVVVDYGARYEVAQTAGVAKVLEKMAFQSNKATSRAELLRSFAARGGNITSNACRETIYYSGELLRDYAPYLVDVLGNVILNNKFDEWEVHDTIDSLESEEQPPPGVSDLVLQGAFGGETLGRPLMSDSPNDDLKSRITPQLLKDTVSTFFQPKRMVLSAAGISHSDLVELASNSPFGQIGNSTEIVRPPARYVGGDVLMQAATPDGLTELSIAFPIEGLTSNDFVPSAVLQILLGGGNSFSSGGPGKGMHSRLYRQVLNKHSFVYGISAFTMPAEDVSLFGLTGATTPDEAGSLLEVMVQEIRTMHSVSQEELARAKNQLKSMVYMQLESRNGFVEDSARQLVSFGKVSSAAEMAIRIDAVTADDIDRLVRSMLRMRPTFVAIGEVKNLPPYEQVARALKL